MTAHGARALDLAAFAITAPGLEPLCAAELQALGIAAVAEQGGVAWRGDIASIARANLWSRLASRIVVRIAQFHARTFFELERHARRVAWEDLVPPNGAAAFRVTCRKSKLYHSDAVAQRFADAVARRVAGGRVAVASGEERDGDTDAGRGANGPQRFVVRFVHDACTVSADTSGALLHLRGYRQALAKAPLRETLAAAVLAGAGWTGDTPLVDPMCGSGTIPLEAARLARRIAPGRDRSFAFTQWPSVDPAVLANAVSAARDAERPSAPVAIAGSDRDAGAIDAARANAARAGVADDVAWSVRAISAIEPLGGGPGLVAINPPYGVRVGESGPLRDLYARLGTVLRDGMSGWRLALLSADPRLERQLGLTLDEAVRTTNGGIPVRLVTGTIPAADARAR